MPIPAPIPQRTGLVAQPATPDVSAQPRPLARSNSLPARPRPADPTLAGLHARDPQHQAAPDTTPRPRQNNLPPRGSPAMSEGEKMLEAQSRIARVQVAQQNAESTIQATKAMVDLTRS